MTVARGQSDRGDQGDDPPFAELGKLLQEAVDKYGTSLPDFKTYGRIPRPQRTVQGYLDGRSAPGRRSRVDQLLISIKGITDAEADRIYDAWERARVIRQHLRLVGSVATVEQQLAEIPTSGGCEFKEVNDLIATLRVVEQWDHPRRPYLFANALDTIKRITHQIEYELEYA